MCSDKPILHLHAQLTSVKTSRTMDTELSRGLLHSMLIIIGSALNLISLYWLDGSTVLGKVTSDADLYA